MDSLVVIFVALLGVVCGQTTEVSQCTATSGPLPINTYITGCTTPPCALAQLDNAVINLTFQAPRTIRSMKTLATAYMSFVGIHIPIPYDLMENAETCNFLENTQCPVQEGEVVNYKLLMFIESVFPVGAALTVEFKIVDEDNNEVITCIRVPIVITPPNSRARHYKVNIADAN